MNRRSASDEALNSSKTSVHTFNHSSSTSKVSDRWTIICLFIASTNILNGLWMIFAPKNWYYNLPASVPTFGPLNYHFIRDLGCVFFLLGIGVVFAAFYLSYRLPLFTMNTAFYVLHMFVHVHEVVSGRVASSMFWVDLPLVYVPTIIYFILNIFMIKQFQTKETIRRSRK
jgi:hypothetical protein